MFLHRLLSYNNNNGIIFQDYDELMTLAEKGDAGKLSVTMKDLKDPNNPDLYDAIPDTQEVFSFGKATTLDKC